jgi:ankyrin repeat protein
MGIKTNNKYERTLREQNTQVMTMLIDEGLNVNGQCRCGRTALHLASEHDDDLIIKVLLKKKANINITDFTGQNALHYALRNSKVNMGVVQHLIDKKIDVKARDNNGITPLQLCCITKNYVLI